VGEVVMSLPGAGLHQWIETTTNDERDRVRTETATNESIAAAGTMIDLAGLGLADETKTVALAREGRKMALVGMIATAIAIRDAKTIGIRDVNRAHDEAPEGTKKAPMFMQLNQLQKAVPQIAMLRNPL